MPIRKRGKTWWIDLTTPGGERIRQSARTTHRAAAQELHDKLKTDAWRAANIGDMGKSWDEAALRYLQRHPNREKARHIARFTAHFRGLRLDQIGTEETERALDGLARPYNWNRHLATLRHLLRTARDEWQWTLRIAHLKPLAEPRRRVEWLTADEAARLVQALPGQHRDLVRIALATGLRLGNILALEWSQVDLDTARAWIHPDQAKARRAIPVPLNDVAIEVIKRQPMHGARIFPRKRIETKVWKRALQAAGIDRRIRFHDLRHTWASWHIQAGTPAIVLQELGGWSTGDMVRRYAHLGAEHLQAHAGAVASQLRHSVTQSETEQSEGTGSQASNGGEGGIRTHVPGKPDHLISSRSMH